MKFNCKKIEYYNGDIKITMTPANDQKLLYQIFSINFRIINLIKEIEFYEVLNTNRYY